MKPEEIITDEEIETVHSNANFGEGITKRDVVKAALLKCACGYYNGHTASQILKEHGLVTEKRMSVTKKGEKYLYAAFKFTNL